MKYADMRKIYINISTDSFTHRETFKASSNHILLQNLPKSSYQVSVGHMSFWNIKPFTGEKSEKLQRKQDFSQKTRFFSSRVSPLLVDSLFFWHKKESTCGVRLYRPSLSVSNDCEITYPAIYLRNI